MKLSVNGNVDPPAVALTVMSGLSAVNVIKPLSPVKLKVPPPGVSLIVNVVDPVTDLTKYVTSSTTPPNTPPVNDIGMPA